MPWLPPSIPQALDFLLDGIAPPICLGCGLGAGAGAGVFCRSCRPSWYAGSRLIEGVPLLSAYCYDEPLVRQALSRFKFQDRPDLGRLLARELVRAPSIKRQTEGLHGAEFVPVPSDPARLALRRYNQAMLIARGLAQRFCGNVHPLLLKRKVSKYAQVQLAKPERQTNVQVSLGPKYLRALPVAAKAVVLVDDVCSTGATLRACIQRLCESGLRVKLAIVFADNP